jgi:hypothetical protein
MLAKICAIPRWSSSGRIGLSRIEEDGGRDVSSPGGDVAAIWFSSSLDELTLSRRSHCSAEALAFFFLDFIESRNFGCCSVMGAGQRSYQRQWWCGRQVLSGEAGAR